MLPVTRMKAEAAIRSQPQPKPAVSVAYAHRKRLNGARAEIFKQQEELQTKLNVD